MPKFIVNSTGDQYFVPDSSQFYVSGLKGETYLRYVPNTDHAMRSPDAATSALAFYQSIISGSARPNFDWRFEPDGAIRVKSETKPSEVRLWQAANPTARDFRLQTIGPAFQSSVLSDQGDGVYIGKVAPPDRGWTAFFVELTYPNGDREPFKLTTGVRVVPDVLPFAPPTGTDGTPPGEAR
jgi:PhoPQ-activated pathogenicity-related protein